MEAPSTEDLQKAFPGIAKYQKSNLPLHIKLVDFMDGEQLMRLAADDTNTYEFYKKMEAYLHDMQLYEHVQAPAGLKQTGFTAEEERLMVTHKFQRHRGPIKGSVYGFKISEWAKNRVRPVWNCYVKEFFKDRVPHYHMQSPRRIFQKLMAISGREDTVFVQFDFASYYDQFKLGEEVSSHFCFKGRDNEVYALSRLPMGFSLACAIAQSATWQILNFPKQSTPFTCIDNVAFAGTVEEVWHDVKHFLQRCCQVKATLNDLSTQVLHHFLNSSKEEQIQQIRNWHQNDFTFLGVRYDWSEQLRSISDKSIDKMQAARRCLQSITGSIAPRQLATLVGILRYASAVSEKTLFDKFELMAWTRRIGGYLQEDLKRWDSGPLVFPNEFKAQILAWFDELLLNEPVKIAYPLPRDVPTTIISDASGRGWGAVRLDFNASKTAQGRWKSEIRSSVEAEPKGILYAARELLSLNDGLVLILTDHKPLVYASQSIAPRSFFYNELLRKLKMEFPSTKFFFQFLPGTDNVADAMSRDKEHNIDMALARRFAGMGWSTALTYIIDGPLCLRCLTPTLPWQF